MPGVDPIAHRGCLGATPTAVRVGVRAMLQAGLIMPTDSNTRKWSPLKPPEMTILADHAILHGDRREDDRLDLPPKLAAVFDILRNKSTQTPIAVAVFGGWGTGKSSAMRWLSDRLRQWSQQDEKKREGHAAIETVWFDPWKYQTREDVWRGLIAEVILACLEVGRPKPETKLQYIERAARQFGAYVGRPFLAALARIKIKANLGDKNTASVGGEISGEAFTAVLDELRKVRKPHTPYLNEFEGALKTWVEEFFPQTVKRGTPRRLALLIDDLDRCLPAVSLQVLEALKLYLNIPGLVFVVGLDRAVLEAVVRTEHAKYGVSEEKSREYLGKMFQVQVDIPPTQAEAREFLTAQIGELDKASEYKWGRLLDASSPDVDGRNREIIESKIAVLGRDNPREIKRMLNSVLLRAWAAAENDKLDQDAPGDAEQKRALRFAQGAQVFLVQRLLWRGLEREDLLLRDDVQEFFVSWSEFVRKYPEFRPWEVDVRGGDEHDALPPRGTWAERLRRPSARESTRRHHSRESTDVPERLPEAELKYGALRDAEPAKQLLADRHLWELMRIPFSHDVAAACAVTPPAMDKPASARRPSSTHDGDAAHEGVASSPRPTSHAERPHWLAVAVARAVDKPVSELSEGDAQRVESLDLSGNADTGDLTPLSVLTSLRTLSLLNTPTVDAGLKQLSSLTSLQILDLRNTQITDEGLTHLRVLTGLRTLDLDRTQIGDAGLAHLSSLSELRVLRMWGTQITDAGLAHLSGLTCLHTVDLGATQITDNGLTHLRALTGLHTLDLDRTQIGDAGLAHLSSLSELRVLRMWGTQITDTGLVHLSGLTHLHTLDLGATQITDAGLEHLTGCTKTQEPQR